MTDYCIGDRVKVIKYGDLGTDAPEIVGKEGEIVKITDEHGFYHVDVGPSMGVDDDGIWPCKSNEITLVKGVEE